MLTFALNLSRRSDGLVTATFPDVPMAVAYGNDDAEAIENAARALKEALDRYAVAGFELPAARAQGQLSVNVEMARIPMPA